MPLAEKLNLLLKYGKIYKEKGNYINLVFYKLDIIFLIVHLINGKMRTPKIEALYRLINWFNMKFDTNIKKLGLCSIDISRNAWFSGFLDCDGSFYSHFNLNKKNIAINVACYMSLSQRQNYPNICSKLKNNSLNFRTENKGNSDYYSYLNVMEEIRLFLNVKNIRIINRKKKNQFNELGYGIRTSKKESNCILINYLSKYPLFSSKYLDFQDWKKIYDLKITKDYKLKKGTNSLKFLKSSMNKGRTVFDWSHLNNFWKI